MAGVFVRKGEVLERIDGATCDRRVDMILHDISKDRNPVSKDFIRLGQSILHGAPTSAIKCSITALS
jgi:hypothetical protein